MNLERHFDRFRDKFRPMTLLGLTIALALSACGGPHSANQSTSRTAPTVAASPSPISNTPLPQLPSPTEPASQEGYNPIVENSFETASANPLSTFAIDVDTASYSNVRRFINEGQLPAQDAVRIEELINYFPYDYPQPTDDRPFSVNTEVAAASWNPQHRLVRIGLQGRRISTENLPSNNLVFLIDVSGSMADDNKLPLLKESLRLMVNELRPADRVSIVVYAGNAGLVLPATPGDQKEKILAAIDQLEAGGSTAGGEGIQLAYKTAQENFLYSGNNRVILATDGDFNVGVSSDAELVRLIEGKRDSDIFLTVLGVGMGNLQDGKLEQLANKGNGNYAYVDSLLEARKVLVKEMGGTLLTIAKDVKVQVEFDPEQVESYRLIGYENRLLADQDFNNDQKDAGEIGSEHAVTALYEVVPRYSTATNQTLMQVNLRYKQPDQDNSQLATYAVVDRGTPLNQASDDFRFTAAIAAYGMVLRNSQYKGEATLDQVLELARQSQGPDLNGYRAEFLRLVEKSKTIQQARR
jgi:Ca-activated chloride channel family protein